MSQSALYLAPISKAFCRISPRRGFWYPDITNLTPSINRENGLVSLTFSFVSSGTTVEKLGATFCVTVVVSIFLVQLLSFFSVALRGGVSGLSPGKTSRLGS